MTHLTRLFKQDYKKAPQLEDILNWTTGVEEVLDDNGDIEVDHVPVDVNLVAAMEVLDFALMERYALYKLDPVSDTHADRPLAVKKREIMLFIGKPMGRSIMISKSRSIGSPSLTWPWRPHC